MATKKAKATIKRDLLTRLAVAAGRWEIALRVIDRHRGDELQFRAEATRRHVAGCLYSEVRITGGTRASQRDALMKLAWNLIHDCRSGASASEVVALQAALAEESEP